MEPATGRILIVDDDAALLQLMTVYLSRLGYRVDACSTAEDGLAMMRAAPSIYTLALVDWSMPGIGGRELAERILEHDPSIRLVVVSGYPAQLSGVESLCNGRVRYLQKPFIPRELVEALK